MGLGCRETERELKECGYGYACVNGVYVCVVWVLCSSGWAVLDQYWLLESTLAGRLSVKNGLYAGGNIHGIYHKLSLPLLLWLTSI